MGLSSLTSTNPFVGSLFTTDDQELEDSITQAIGNPFEDAIRDASCHTPPSCSALTIQESPRASSDYLPPNITDQLFHQARHRSSRVLFPSASLTTHDSEETRPEETLYELRQCSRRTQVIWDRLSSTYFEDKRATTYLGTCRLPLKGVSKDIKLVGALNFRGSPAVIIAPQSDVYFEGSIKSFGSLKVDCRNFIVIGPLSVDGVLDVTASQKAFLGANITARKTQLKTQGFIYSPYPLGAGRSADISCSGLYPYLTRACLAENFEGTDLRFPFLTSGEFAAKIMHYVDPDKIEEAADLEQVDLADISDSESSWTRSSRGSSASLRTPPNLAEKHDPFEDSPLPKVARQRLKQGRADSSRLSTDSVSFV